MNTEQTRSYVAGMDIAEDFIRVSISLIESDQIEIYSCQTQTTLVLPMRDVDLLITNLKNFHQTESPRETIFLDPSS